MLLQRIGGPRWLASICVVWGIIAGCFGCAGVPPSGGVQLRSRHGARMRAGGRSPMRPLNSACGAATPPARRAPAGPSTAQPPFWSCACCWELQRQAAAGCGVEGHPVAGQTCACPFSGCADLLLLPALPVTSFLPCCHAGGRHPRYALPGDAASCRPTCAALMQQPAALPYSALSLLRRAPSLAPFEQFLFFLSGMWYYASTFYLPHRCTLPMTMASRCSLACAATGASSAAAGPGAPAARRL